MNIDVGCGARGSKHAGFIGVDRSPKEEIWRRKDSYVQSDVLTDGLPFKEGSVEVAIFLHVIEHYPPPEGLLMLKEIHRVVVPGGLLYVATPDLRIMATKYIEQDFDFYNKCYRKSVRRIWRGPTLADRFMDSIIGMGVEHGHKYAYDVQSLRQICRRAGFKPVTVVTEGPYNTRPDHELLMVGHRS